MDRSVSNGSVYIGTFLSDSFGVVSPWDRVESSYVELSVTYGWEGESYEAKVRWWQSLTVEERMQRFAEIGDLVMALNPSLVRKKTHAKPIPGRVVVLELPQG